MPSNKRPPLNYYRSNQAPKKSPFLRPAPATRRLRSKVSDFLIILTVLALIIYGSMLRPQPKVVLNSQTYHPASAYLKAATADFKRLKNRNKVTFDQKAIIDSLKQRFPEITAGTVDLPLLGQTPTLRLDIAAPSFFLNSQGIDYVINSQGVATAAKVNLPAVKNLPLIIDQSSFDIRLGQQVLAASEVKFINSLLAECKRAKISLSSLSIPPLAKELDVRTKGRGYYTRFYLGGDAAVQAGQFLAARHRFDKSGKQPRSYLDVRIDGKIYYK